MESQPQNPEFRNIPENFHPCKFNPFKPNGLAYTYQWNEPISNFRNSGWYFSFCSNFHRTFCRQTVEVLFTHHIMQFLIWVCIWVKQDGNNKDSYIPQTQNDRVLGP